MAIFTPVLKNACFIQNIKLKCLKVGQFYQNEPISTNQDYFKVKRSVNKVFIFILKFSTKKSIKILRHMTMTSRA